MTGLQILQPTRCDVPVTKHSMKNDIQQYKAGALFTGKLLHVTKRRHLAHIWTDARAFPNSRVHSLLVRSGHPHFMPLKTCKTVCIRCASIVANWQRCEVKVPFYLILTLTYCS